MNRHVWHRTPLASPRKPMTQPIIDIACELKDQCGSCRFVNEPYQSSLESKFNTGIEALKSQLGQAVTDTQILPVQNSPRPLAYRSHFKLAVRKAPEDSHRRFQIGLFQPGTHRVVEIFDCPIHSWPLKRLSRDLRDSLEESDLTPYDESTHEGDLRYLIARAAHKTSQLQLTFVVTNQKKAALRQIISYLKAKGHKVEGTFMNVNSERGNVILGQETIQITGKPYLRERMCDLSLQVSPTSFFQVNPWQAESIYRRIEQLAGSPTLPGEVAWDFYSGVGQIALMFARQGYRTLGIEEVESATLNAKTNAKINQLELEFLSGRTEDLSCQLPDWAQAPSLVAVNPSRRGLAAPVRKLLGSLSNLRFVYLSCEMETLARDLKELVTSGYTLHQIEGFDMFPQTEKMEWLAILTKK